MSPALSDSPATLAITGTRLDGRDVDVLIHGSRIAAIHATGGAPEQVAAALRRVDGRRTAVLPGLANAHTHSAMAIMRGLADESFVMIPRAMAPGYYDTFMDHCRRHGFTPRIEQQAKQMKDEYISVEHVFLGILQRPCNAASEIFKTFGIGVKNEPYSK